MLSSLQIENVAVIQKANVHFEKGLNVLTGETGAGKTALVEGLALRIHEGRVPAALRGLRIFALNASSMSSRYKGAFAEKLSEIVSVIKKVPGAVLFIDNLHMPVSYTHLTLPTKA